MSEQKQSPETSGGGLSRRGFLGAATATAAGLVVAQRWVKPTPGWAQGSMPNSKFGNVQIGSITYSFRSMPGANDPYQILSYLVGAGLSSTELMGEPIMRFLGAPTAPAGVGGGGGGGGQGQATLTPEQQRARTAYQAELNRFYASPDMTKVAALKKLFNDAGVSIHMTKLNAGTPEAAAFAFQVAKALGAKGNSAELSEDAAKLQGPIAQRYGVVANMHNHAQPGEANFPGFAAYLAMSPGVVLNLDVGHYYGSTGKNPVAEIRQFNQRIGSMHLKDKTSPAEGNQNMPWGYGGTPLAEILRTVNRERYNINADIELEYAIPEGSNAVKEVARCLEYCREALTRPVPTPQQRAPAAAPAGATGAPTSAPRP